MKRGAPKPSPRRERVAHTIRDTLTEMIAADIKDPRVHAPTVLTISRVELNVDMSVARCYVSMVADDATADAALEGLGKAAGFLRGPLGRRVGLQRAPELRFYADPTIDMSEKLAAIVREDEHKARAAGRDLTAPAPAPGSPFAAAHAEPFAPEEPNTSGHSESDEPGEERS